MYIIYRCDDYLFCRYTAKVQLILCLLDINKLLHGLVNCPLLSFLSTWSVDYKTASKIKRTFSQVQNRKRIWNESDDHRFCVTVCTIIFPYFIWNWGRGIIIYTNHAHFNLDFGKGWDPLICPILLGAFRDHSGGHLNPTSSKHTITASGVKLWDCPSTWLGITENIWMVLRG